jgi:hypothetical protein
MSEKKLGKHTRAILTEMFSVVGDTFTDDRVKSDIWFMANRWTYQQENAFAKWLEDYLYKNHTEARKEMTLGTKTKASIRKQIPWFLLMYGWGYKED